MYILEMIPGPMFLVIYFILSLTTIIYTYNKIKKRFRASELNDISNFNEFNLDEYDFAYLKEGKNNVLKTIIFKLMKLKLIEKKIENNKEVLFRYVNLPKNDLKEIEIEFLNKIESPIQFKNIYLIFSNSLKNYFELIEKNLLNKHFLYTLEDEKYAKKLRNYTIIILLIMGIPKLLLGINNNKPIGFLAIMIFLFILSSILILKNKFLEVTPLGKNYLKTITFNYRNNRNHPLNNSLDSNLSGDHDSLLFALLGIYAFSSLDSFSDMNSIFTTIDEESSIHTSSIMNINNDSGGCSSSGCSSGGCSSGCSSGCGGGCGGCG